MHVVTLICHQDRGVTAARVRLPDLRCPGTTSAEVFIHRVACPMLDLPDLVFCSSSLGVTWQRRTVRVDHERVWIGNPETHVVLDSIPLREIGRVVTKTEAATKKTLLGEYEC